MSTNVLMMLPAGAGVPSGAVAGGATMSAGAQAGFASILAPFLAGLAGTGVDGGLSGWSEPTATGMPPDGGDGPAGPELLSPEEAATLNALLRDAPELLAAVLSLLGGDGDALAAQAAGAGQAAAGTTPDQATARPLWQMLAQAVAAEETAAPGTARAQTSGAARGGGPLGGGGPRGATLTPAVLPGAGDAAAANTGAAAGRAVARLSAPLAAQAAGAGQAAAGTTPDQATARPLWQMLAQAAAQAEEAAAPGTARAQTVGAARGDGSRGPAVTPAVLPGAGDAAAANTGAAAGRAVAQAVARLLAPLAAQAAGAGQAAAGVAPDQAAARPLWQMLAQAAQAEEPVVPGATRAPVSGAARGDGPRGPVTPAVLPGAGDTATVTATKGDNLLDGAGPRENAPPGAGAEMASRPGTAVTRAETPPVFLTGAEVREASAVEPRTPAPLPAQGVEQSIARQVVHRVLGALESWRGQAGQAVRLELQLHPPELGRVVIRLLWQTGGLEARFLTGDQTVRSAIEQALPQLREALGRQDVHLLDVSADLARDNDGEPTRHEPRGGRLIRYQTVREGAEEAAGAAPEKTSTWVINRLA